MRGAGVRRGPATTAPAVPSRKQKSVSSEFQKWTVHPPSARPAIANPTARRSAGVLDRLGAWVTANPTNTSAAINDSVAGAP